MEDIDGEIETEEGILETYSEGEDDYIGAMTALHGDEDDPDNIGYYAAKTAKEEELAAAQKIVDDLWRAQELDDAAIAGARFQSA